MFQIRPGIWPPNFLTKHGAILNKNCINYLKIAQTSLKYLGTCSKWGKECQKQTFLPKIVKKNTRKWPKWPKNCQKWYKNCPKWVEMFRKMVQIRSGIPNPNCLTKSDEKLGKMAKMTQTTALRKTRAS